jgi:hypothetical protein
VKGLVSNLRILAIAVFASLGGFVYGCTHPYLVKTSALRKLCLLIHHSRRQPRHVWPDFEHDFLLEHGAPRVHHKSRF